MDEDASGLTFEEWDPSADSDASQAPVAMIVNSSELRAVQRTSPKPLVMSVEFYNHVMFIGCLYCRSAE